MRVKPESGAKKAPQLQMVSDKTKTHIEKVGIEDFLRNPPVPYFGIAIFIMLVSWLVYQALGRLTGLEPTTVIGATLAVAALLAFITWLLVKKGRGKNAQLIDAQLKMLAKRYGDTKATLAQMQAQIVYEPTIETTTGDFITKDWFVSSRGHMIKHCDIAAIAGGTTKRGVHVLTIDGEMFAVMFGASKGAMTFDLIKQANPRLLGYDDGIETAIFDNPQQVIDKFLRKRK